MPTVTFMPSRKSVSVQPGTKLLEACRRAGFALSTPCGSKGLCGKCRVRVMEGSIPVDGRQRACLPERMLAAGWRAACVADVYGDLILADPRDHDVGGVILTDFLAREPRGDSGLWDKDLAMAEPAAGDQRDDQSRFLAALGTAETAGGGAFSELPLPLLRQLPEKLRACSYRCRATGDAERVLAMRSVDGASRPLGLAFDIGTTTLAAALCDIRDGTVLAVASRANPQSRYGDDVISRVDYAAKGAAELAEMRLSVVGALEELADSVCGEAGVVDHPILGVVGANTVMNHLLLGVSPRALAVSPFIPAFRGPVSLWASEIGWRGKEPPFLHIIPNISAYVGGDITAGILTHDLHIPGGNRLFLDVGTNGEMALATGGRIYACATAAGPAFEGARIKQGVRAASGAISRVGLSRAGLLEIGIVDSASPAVGICGTGLLDAVATLLRAGLLDGSGRLLDEDEIREITPRVNPGLLLMLHEDDDGPAVWLERPAGRGGMGVSLTQRDIREFQLAKGAVAAGVKVLLAVAGLKPPDLDQVLLAGGFGNYLDPGSALAVGLLPPEVDRDKVHSVGNASLAGARLCLLSERERAEAEEIARRVEYVELSGREDFQNAFAEEMLFPECE